MRPFHIAPAALLLALLPGLALSQEQAECEYRNPDHPGWNFTRPCTVTVGPADAGRRTTVARVSNGSEFTLVETETAEGARLTVNGHAARAHPDGRPGCYLTIKDEETICIHGEYVDPAAAETAAAPDPAAGSGPAAPAATMDAAFGGAEAGHCLAWVASDSREGLIGKGPCKRRNDCAEDEGEGGMSCLTDFIWADGRETVITSQAGVYTLDGAVAVDAGEGCFTDEAEGLHFCFSKSRMTEARYPALAMDPAPVLVPMAVAGPEAGSVAPGPTENRCSFLRGEVEVSNWACSVAVQCEPPLCTVSYLFENGTSITLDTADGQVMLMNGAKANPTPWAEGAPVEVTRPGAPYTFRFTPGAAAPAE